MELSTICVVFSQDNCCSLSARWRSAMSIFKVSVDLGFKRKPPNCSRPASYFDDYTSARSNRASGGYVPNRDLPKSFTEQFCKARLRIRNYSETKLARPAVVSVRSLILATIIGPLEPRFLKTAKFLRSIHPRAALNSPGDPP